MIPQIFFLESRYNNINTSREVNSMYWWSQGMTNCISWFGSFTDNSRSYGRKGCNSRITSPFSFLMALQDYFSHFKVSQSGIQQANWNTTAQGINHLHLVVGARLEPQTLFRLLSMKGREIVRLSSAYINSKLSSKILLVWLLKIKTIPLQSSGQSPKIIVFT